MSRKRSLFAIVSAVTLALVGANCKKSSDDFGEPCRSNSECDSQLCVLWDLGPQQPGPVQDWCTRLCDTTGDCPDGYICTALVSGQTACLFPCSDRIGYYEWSGGYACYNGVPTPCSSVPYGDYCYECGCNDTDYCNATSSSTPPDACLPKKSTGESCTGHEECLHDVCVPMSPFSDENLTCMVPVGAACNDTNCQVCMGGGLFCSLSCGDHPSLCPLGTGCIGTDPMYYCRKDCKMDGYWEPDPSKCPGNMECRTTLSADHPFVCYDP